MWQPFNEGVNVGGQIGNAIMHLVPLPTPVPAALGELQIDRLCIPLYASNASNSTGTLSLSHSFGLYTKNGNTLSLAFSTSYSTAWTFSGTSSRFVAPWNQAAHGSVDDNRRGWSVLCGAMDSFKLWWRERHHQSDACLAVE